MGSRFPISILPGVIAELRRIPELLLCDIGSEALDRRIIRQSAPWNGVVAVTQANKSAEAHDCISYAA